MDINTRNIQAARNLGWLFLAIAALSLAFNHSGVRLWPFVTVLSVGLVLNILSHFIPTVRMIETGWSRRAYMVQLLAGITVISLALGFSGGISSPLYPCIYLLLMVPAITDSIFVTASITLFALLAFLLGSGLVAGFNGTNSALAFIRIALLVSFPMLVNIILSSYRRRLRDRETFSTLYRISRSLGESLNLKQVLHRLLEEVDRVFNTDISSVRLLDPGTNTLVVKASGAEAEQIVEEQIEIRLGEGFIGWVAKTGEPFIINDMRKDPRFATFERARKKVASAIATPIKIGERTIGVVSCASSRLRRFSEEDLELLTSVASLAAAAIERAELYQQQLSRGEAVIESMVDGLIVVDGENRAVLTNRTVRDMLDIRPGVGEPLEDLLKGRVLEWRKLCRDVRTGILGPAGGVPPPFTTELSAGEDHRTVLKVKASPITSQWGKVIGAALLLENVTEVVRLTAELAVEKRKFEVVLENVAAGVIAVNDSGNILIANSAAFHMLSVERPWWWPGASLEDAIPEPSLVKAIRDAAGGEEVFNETVVLDSGRHLEVSCVPIRDLSPGRDGTVAVLHDVTEIHQLEQAKSDFVSMVSHELRTPLTSIKAYVGTLLREDVEFDAVTQRNFINVIARESERMIRLINDLLDMSRIEAGRLDLKPTLVDLPDLVRRVISRIEPQTDIHRVVLELPGEMEPAIAEPDKLEQVILNLMSNAMKYSPGGGEVNVSVRRLEGKAIVAVADGGMGIPAGQLPYIFDKYHRAGRGPELGVRGAGLGLYVTKTIVEAHGGRIWAESEEGRGTTVMFTVPLAGPEGGATGAIQTGASDG